MNDSTQLKKRLYRSRTERMIAGICGGLAKYFDISPSRISIVSGNISKQKTIEIRSN